ncbi:PRC-barrel domain-containing protein [Yoonia litorea]|uniref:PRC-barrel domain-containing protein n=1 Tax=Yoonia litorea TaxID=1123755 RepID=A0A1I6MZY7_9RHOB|nr:PRC-barrel domain-containing protein [Yoonia litorea]SFS21207.1 PRC-barrel domain-containing protein [Yoonia litorea]
MKRLLTTTAAALALATAAHADAHSEVFSDQPFDPEFNLNASELIGMRVYASEQSIENGTFIQAGAETEWEDIGEINEILLTRDGDVQSLIVGVGGFLGIGEKDVAINMQEVRFIEEEGETDDFFLVIEATAVGVQDAPSYEYNLATNTLDEDDDMAEETMASDTTETEEMNDGGMVASTMDDEDMSEDTMMADAEMQEVTPDELTTEALTGAPVISVNDEEIGEVGELLITADGELDRAIIDVGGFLGLGEKPVAVDMDDLRIMRMADGGDLRVYIDMTREALESKPEYQG